MDLYFEKNYGRLYEEVEGGLCEVFEFENSVGTVRHLYIKRQIPFCLEGEVYYDAVTPYGYGGPLITHCTGNRAELAAAFESAFQKYCDENRIVCEFIRFHPFFENAQDFSDSYQAKFKRKTIQTNLKDHDDPILAEYSASCRRDIRHALKAGVEYNIVQHPAELKPFAEIYHSTMKRNEANAVYYFNDDYFTKCIELFGENLVMVEVSYQGQIIGRSLNFLWGKMIHAHLTGTLQDFHHLAPAYVQQYALALWGKENGYETIHHGGGRSGEPDDKLYLFKKKFGRNRELQYFTGHKIWDEKIYSQLLQAAKVAEVADFHPALWQELSCRVQTAEMGK